VALAGALTVLLPTWLERLAASEGFAVRLPGGQSVGTATPHFAIVLRSTALLRRLARTPTPLALGRAFLDGELDLEGDVFAAMKAMHALEGARPAVALRVIGMLRAAIRPLRRRARDISSHYDLPAEFFDLFLDSRLVYTCAYWQGPDATLEEAQLAKLDLVCRKLRLARGEHLLDLGCGWGGLALHAAGQYGAVVHAVTLSPAQAKWASEAVRRSGLADRARVEHADWRDVRGRYQKVAAIGMIEHVGRRAYPLYFGSVRDRLEQDGLFLNHGITMRRGATWSSEMEFLDRHVFPGLDLVDLSATTACMEDAGLEVLDVENLRPHYARTTREWTERLWRQREKAVAIAGERAWRTWVSYLAAASVAFEAGWIGLQQVLARTGGARDGRNPLLRETIYQPEDRLTACGTARSPAPRRPG
jgi:cyclopropane-fatty-acyl-phospholipid synthase